LYWQCCCYLYIGNAAVISALVMMLFVYLWMLSLFVYCECCCYLDSGNVVCCLCIENAVVICILGMLLLFG
jgi:hypothetical protein